jgi:hypothetical protein
MYQRVIRKLGLTAGALAILLTSGTEGWAEDRGWGRLHKHKHHLCGCPEFFGYFGPHWRPWPVACADPVVATMTVLPPSTGPVEPIPLPIPEDKGKPMPEDKLKPMPPDHLNPAAFQQISLPRPASASVPRSSTLYNPPKPAIHR